MKVEYIQQKKPLRVLEAPHPLFAHRLVVDPYQGCAYGCRYCWTTHDQRMNYDEGSYHCHVGVKTDIVYQVNALMPQDPAIEITKQSRDEPQQGYRLEFEVAAPGRPSPSGKRR